MQFPLDPKEHPPHSRHKSHHSTSQHNSNTGYAASRSYKPRAPARVSSPSPPPPDIGSQHHLHASRHKRRSFSTRTGSGTARPVTGIRRMVRGLSTQTDISSGPSAGQDGNSLDMGDDDTLSDTDWDQQLPAIYHEFDIGEPLATDQANVPSGLPLKGPIPHEMQDLNRPLSHDLNHTSNVNGLIDSPPSTPTLSQRHVSKPGVGSDASSKRWSALSNMTSNILATGSRTQRGSNMKSGTHETSRLRASRPAMLPCRLPSPFNRVKLTRRRCERGMVLATAGYLMKKLGHEMHEWQVAVEIGIVVMVTIAYLALRTVRTSVPTFPSISHTTINEGSIPTAAGRLDKESRSRSPVPPSQGVAQRAGNTSPVAAFKRPANLSPSPSSMWLQTQRLSPYDIEDSRPGSHGTVYATDPKEFRECVDDGAVWAMLLGPILSGSLFYETCCRLKDLQMGVAGRDVLMKGWRIVDPLVSRSTPVFEVMSPSSDIRHTSEPDDTILALSALAYSRRQLCHLMCLLSILLTGHAIWSRRRHLQVLTGQSGNGHVVKLSPASTNPEPHFEHDQQQSSTVTACEARPAPVSWSKCSEWRRTAAICGMSFILTASFVLLKIIAQLLGAVGSYGESGCCCIAWRVAFRLIKTLCISPDFTYSDLTIATLFFQFSLYVCSRLARRGFTFGELAVVAQVGTGFFMEVVNLTRTGISVFNTPFIRTYRLPTPLLVFQLALIPGSFLCGFLLSPLLVLSRRIAQRPVHRLRHPEEKELYRKGLAAGFYAGSILICGGLIGLWVKWCLASRNPIVWVLVWLTQGMRWWSRPLLIGYWALLATISVAGWTRQLHRARKKRVWAESKVTNGQRKVTVVSNATCTRVLSGNGNVGSSHGGGSLLTDRQAGSFEGHSNAAGSGTQTPSNSAGIGAGDHAKPPRLGEVASHMMDEVDQRLPVFSINARRKFFHGLAVVMFVPGIIADVSFNHHSNFLLASLADGVFVSFLFHFGGLRQPAFTHLSFSLAFALFNFAEYVRYFALYPFGAAVHLFLNEFLDKKDSGTAIMSHFYLLVGCAGGLWLDS